MNKLNKNSINLGLKVLTVLAFAFLLLPTKQAAAQVASITGCGEGGCNSAWGAPQNYGYAAPATSGGNCYYNSCNTNVTNYYNNGAQQPAYQQTYQQSYPANYQQSYQSTQQPYYQQSQVSYVPPVQQNIVYAPTPVVPTNIVYSTSVNPNPTPTVTRVITRTVTTPSTTSTTTTNPSGTTYPNGTVDGASTQNGNNAGDLASNALFGSSGFLPSGLIQWILFAIFILVIVILARRIFGAKTAYEEAPMKYE